MNIRDCYKKFNGNYDDVLERLLSEERIKKFCLRFLDNNDLVELNKQISLKDWEKAFVIAHTSKGLALNLGFTDYTKTISEITEILRPREVNEGDLNKLTNLMIIASSETEKIKNVLKTLE